MMVFVLKSKRTHQVEGVIVVNTNYMPAFERNELREKAESYKCELIKVDDASEYAIVDGVETAKRAIDTIMNVSE